MTDKRIRIILDKTQAQRNAKELDQSVQSIGQSADKTQFALNKLAVAIAAAVSVASLRGIADLVQGYQAMSERVRMATDSAEEFEMVQSRLNATANATYRSLEEAQELYLRTSSALKGMGYQTSQALDVIDSISYAFVRNATTVDKANSAISAFGKAVSKGKVEADAWESILVAIPTVVENIAKASGETEQAIRAMGAQGKLSVEALTEGLRLAREENKRLADGMAVNLTDAGVRVRNALTQVFVKLEENTGAIAAFTKFIVDAADAIAEFAGDSEKMEAAMEGAVTVAEVLALVIGSRLAASIILAGKSTVIATVESIRYQSALASMAGVSTTAAAAQTALAAASRAAGAAMTLLGGPLGVVLLAASALVYFSSTASDSKPSVDELTKSVNKLSDAQRNLAIIKINEQLDDLRETADKAAKTVSYLESIQQLEGTDEWSKRILEQKVKTEELNEQIRILVERRKELLSFKPTVEAKFLPGSGITGISPVTIKKAETETKTESGSNEVENARSVTDSLRLELSARLQISQAYRDAQASQDDGAYKYQIALLEAKMLEEKALSDQRATEDAQRRGERLQQDLENDKLSGDSKILLQMEYEQQERIAKEIHQEELTAIEERGKLARDELNRAEFKARLDNAAALGNALMTLGQGQSKRIFKIGQKLALAQAAVALPTAVLESFRNGGGYPWGLVPAAAMLATGTKNIQQIRSAGAGLGGGGGESIPPPSLGGGSGSPNINTNTGVTEQLPQQRRIIDLRNVKLSDKIPVSALVELLEEDGAVVALESARDDAQRRGVIGVTAR